MCPIPAQLQAEHLRGESSESAWLRREAYRLTRHVKGSLGRVRTPTLMIHARQDDMASLANVRYVRTHLGTDQFKEVIVENSYHMITFDNDFDYAITKAIQFMSTRNGLRAGDERGQR